MQFVRVESVQGSRIFCIFEVTGDEYNQIIVARNDAQIEQERREQIERENEIDRERERQWYRE